MQRFNPAIEKPIHEHASPTGSSVASDAIVADLCVIGAGAGGLSMAAEAAQLGLKVVLIEKRSMGGGRNNACVSSKALIAAGRRAHLMRTSGDFGIASVNPQIDQRDVQSHIRNVVTAIAPNDSPERLAGLGVHVIYGAAAFVDKETVVAGDSRIKARRFVVATGSTPDIPSIAGLDSVSYFTTESIFENRQRIDHLVVIGGGSIGLELAQAYLRLGSRVTVLEAVKSLAKDDPELSEFVLRRLRSEGMDVRESAKAEQFGPGPAGGIRVTFATAAGSEELNCSHVLLATGRRPALADLNLEAAGIKYDRHRIQVNKRLTTSNSRILAIGDVIGGPRFTHVAAYQAGIVLRRLLSPLPLTAREAHLPRVTYTDPELAQVGLTEQAARARHGRINVFRWPLQENDRAQAERTTEGFVKAITDKKGAILGAGIAGVQAGELIQVWSLAISQGLKIAAMAGGVAPYPTLGEVNTRGALGYNALAGGNPLTRKVSSMLRQLG